MKNRSPIQGASNEGVALILVLGFLAVLTVMAVAFVVNMRTERLSSRAYLDSVRARHFVDVALARALHDLNSHLVTNQLVALTNAFLASTGEAGNDTLALLDDDIVRSYLPANLPEAPASVFTNVYLDPFNPNPTQVIGRVAYLTVNLTGLLDINHAGQLTRGKGQSAGEIQIVTNFIAGLRDNGWPDFQDKLSNEWRRIDNLRELSALAVPANFTEKPSQFMPFSRSLVERDPDGNPKVNIGGGREELLEEEKKNAIEEAFRKSGIDESQIDGVFNQLIDYVDDDLIPENPGGLSAEPVPMINEVVASGNFTREDSGANKTYGLSNFKIQIEWWYPFPVDGERTQAFTIDTSPKFSFATVQPRRPESIRLLQELLNPTNGANSFALEPPSGEHDIDAPGYYTSTYLFSDIQGVVSTSDLSSLSINIGLLDLQVFVDQTGVVDRVQSTPVFRLDLFANAGNTNGLSCLDPRVNHVADNWKQESVVSLGSLNSNIWAQSDKEPVDLTVDPVMYSRQFPLGLPKAGVGYGSVAELGYLSIGKPWRTIALYKSPVGQPTSIHPVLDYFTLRDSDSKTNGLINMNSAFSNVLETAIFGMAAQKTPELEPDFTFDADKAREMAEALRDYRVNKGKPIDRLSEIGELSSVFSPTFDAAMNNDPAIESVIRNAIGLLTVREGMFAVIMQAESLNEAGKPTAVEKALAFVWRDPEEIAGVNESIVRFFTWLPE